MARKKTKNSILEFDQFQQVYMINGKGELDGFFEEYNSDGLLYMKGFYKNGKEEGVFEMYEPGSTVLKQKETFKNGQLNGPCEYYEQGKLIRKGNYINGCFIPEEILQPRSITKSSRRQISSPQRIHE